MNLKFFILFISKIYNFDVRLILFKTLRCNREEKYDYCDLLLRLYSHDLFHDYLFFCKDRVFLIKEIETSYDLKHKKLIICTDSELPLDSNSIINNRIDIENSNLKIIRYVKSRIFLLSKIRKDFEITQKKVYEFREKYKNITETSAINNDHDIYSIYKKINFTLDHLSYPEYFYKYIISTEKYDANTNRDSFKNGLLEKYLYINNVESISFANFENYFRIMTSGYKKIALFYLKLKMIRYGVILRRIDEVLGQLKFMLKEYKIDFKKKKN